MVILKNAGDLDAVDLELRFSVLALADDDGDRLGSVSGSWVMTNWDRLKSGSSRPLQLPMSDLKGFLRNRSPTQKAVLLIAAYRRESDRLRYREFAAFFFLDDTLALASNQRIEEDREYQRIVKAVKTIPSDLVDYDWQFKLLTPVSKLPTEHR